MASILHNAFAATDSFYGLQQPKVELKTFDGKRVVGTFSSGKGVQLDKKDFDFSATFSAPILHRPAPTATIAPTPRSPSSPSHQTSSPSLCSNTSLACKIQIPRSTRFVRGWNFRRRPRCCEM